MLFLKHGVHVVDAETPAAPEATGAVRASAVAPSIVRAVADNDETTPYDYLFDKIVDDPAKHLPADNPAAIVNALTLLGEAMAEATPPPNPNSTIPPVYTYWGQFIDHDMTANTDSNIGTLDITRPDLAPMPPATVTASLRNLRDPGLGLDSLYGDGPSFIGDDPLDAKFYDGVKFRIGTCTDIIAPDAPFQAIPPGTDLDRDLPRIGALIGSGIVTQAEFSAEQQAKANFDTFAFVGDTRNDENLIISQFHLAFLKFHNRAVDAIVAGGHPGSGKRQRQIFRRARQLVRWHYQWLVVHDYLKTVTRAGVADKVLLGKPQHYKPRKKQAYMPLEYSVAAYRYGHSMVRATYDHNRNFAPATFEQLFEFVGNGHVVDNGVVVPRPFRGAPTLPSNWIIEWDRFTDKGSSRPFRFARKIDTHIAPPLLDLINEGNDAPSDPIRKLMKQLASRNLLRGYLLSLPTGQAAAEAMGVEPLSPEELRQGASTEVLNALEAGGFVERTPLWYYILKEAEVRCNGNTLGQLGSRIVCETIIGQLYADPESYLNQKGWDPADSPLKCDDGTPITTIRDFLRFAGVAPQAGPADI